MTLEITQGGLLTTVQDRGRHNHQGNGVPVSGPMDDMAHRCANLLVGNDDTAAALEITIVGPAIRFTSDTLIALAGAEFGATLDGLPFPSWHAAIARAGSVVTFRGAPTGCHAYLAVAGGIDVPLVLESRSTYLRAGFGGLSGRALKPGDVLSTLEPSIRALHSMRTMAGGATTSVVARWGVGPSMHATPTTDLPIRLIPGAHNSLLGELSQRQLFGDEFRISTQSDRMGYRLTGLKLGLSTPTEMLSEGVTFGTMQLPPGGDPIILMADRQTTGGYPRIGEVASVDLPRLAQLRPGDGVRFRPVDVDEAQRLHAAREHDFRLLALAIDMRHNTGPGSF